LLAAQYKTLASLDCATAYGNTKKSCFLLALHALHCDLILQSLDKAATTKRQTRILPWRQIFNRQPKLSRPHIFANPLDWRNSCELSPRYATAPELPLGYWVATSLFVAGAPIASTNHLRGSLSRE
jgi:hypothetical protein